MKHIPKGAAHAMKKAIEFNVVDAVEGGLAVGDDGDGDGNQQPLAHEAGLQICVDRLLLKLYVLQFKRNIKFQCTNDNKDGKDGDDNAADDGNDDEKREEEDESDSDGDDEVKEEPAAADEEEEEDEDDDDDDDDYDDGGDVSWSLSSQPLLLNKSVILSSAYSVTINEIRSVSADFKSMLKSKATVFETKMRNMIKINLQSIIALVRMETQLFLLQCFVIDLLFYLSYLKAKTAGQQQQGTESERKDDEKEEEEEENAWAVSTTSPPSSSSSTSTKTSAKGNLLDDRICNEIVNEKRYRAKSRERSVGFSSQQKKELSLLQILIDCIKKTATSPLAFFQVMNLIRILVHGEYKMNVTKFSATGKRKSYYYSSRSTTTKKIWQ